MIVGKTSSSISKSEVFSKVSEAQVANAVFPEVKAIPCVICSPLRQDKKPSFSLYMTSGGHVAWKDFATNDRGSLMDLLCRYWNCSFSKALDKICELSIFKNIEVNIKPKQIKTLTRKESSSQTKIQVTVRPWRDYDYEYWASYGITKPWLKYANIVPISHKIVTKRDEETGKTNRYIFPADKLAYCMCEWKDGQLSIKIYQPYNTKGFKWCSRMDRSVWSLWTKIPQYGDNLIIGSSTKDCLNISCNLHIPAICMQGEGYEPKPQIIEELKNRYKNIIVFYDNDYHNPMNPGRTDSLKLADKYNLKRVEIPAKYEAKDPSDLYKKYGKEKYMEIMSNILKPVLWKNSGNL